MYIYMNVYMYMCILGCRIYLVLIVLILWGLVAVLELRAWLAFV